MDQFTATRVTKTNVITTDSDEDDSRTEEASQSALIYKKIVSEINRKGLKPVDDLTQDLVALVKYLKWKKITLISLTTVHFPYLAYFKKAIEAFQEMNICFEFYHVDPF